MKLNELCAQAPEIDIHALSSDSRTIENGDMYFCLEGMNVDGHQFIDDAIAKGAKCIVHSKPLDHHQKGVAYLQVENVNRTLNAFASKFYGNPSQHMKVFGVTGTNGKSTISSIIEDIYSNFVPCGYIGTIAIRYKDVVKAPSLTTPDPIEIHRSLKEMYDHDMRAVALEVSSHGLALGRVMSVDFDIAIFTNLTHDHMDFHGTFENYCAAKQILFKNLKPSATSIFNIDDGYAKDMMAVCPCKKVTFSIEKQADYYASDIILSTNSTSFNFHHDGKIIPVQTNLIARYNVSNLMAALVAICETGIDIDDLVKYTPFLKQVEGRMERIDCGQDFNVFVDFAHTPDGLRKVYSYAKAITPSHSNIITVFGSAGKRDKVKRKIFGEIADEYCDTIILTEDDPRDEDPKQIADEIRSGIKNCKTIFIEDRIVAIQEAINCANSGDSILILGKGDEVFMHREFGKEDYLGDHVVARKAIEQILQESNENNV